MVPGFSWFPASRYSWVMASKTKSRRRTDKPAAHNAAKFVLKIDNSLTEDDIRIAEELVRKYGLENLRKKS